MSETGPRRQSTRPRFSRAPAWQLASLTLLAPTAAAVGQSVEETRSSGASIEEITVTARKFEEDAFGVPLSVQVLVNDYFEATNPANLYQIQFDVPGLVVANLGMNGAGISLRGVTAEAGQGLAVTPYFNGVYLGRSILALSHPFDLERIEVIKGPQSTLYGRNATGGSINMISRAPEDEFSASLETVAGSFDTLRMEGHVNFAAERIAVRLAGVRSEGDGFIRNSVDERTFAADDYGAIRVSVSARPTDTLRMHLTAGHMSDDGASGELWLPNRAFLPDPDNIWLTTVTLANPYLRVGSDFVGIDIASDIDAGTLTFITGYVRNVTRDVDDCSNIPGQLCVRSYQPQDYEQRSQEVRFASPAGNRHNWLVGVYFLDANELTNFSLRRLGSRPVNDYSAHGSETASALFGQTTLSLTDRVSFTAGLRASSESHEKTNSGTGINDSPIPLSIRNNWDNTSWRIGIDYTQSENLLFYASLATGFKTGGTASGRLVTGEFDTYDPEELTAFEAGAKYRPDGRRWTLQGSAFFYDFEDLQVVTTTTVADSTNILFSVDNATDARIQGIDVSADFAISKRLTLSGGLVWAPVREFVDFTSMVTGDVLSGNFLSRAPKWTTATSVIYKRPMGAMRNFSVRATYAYRSKFFFTKENEPANSQEAFGLLNLFTQFELSGEWYVFASARNVLNTEYFTQAFIQSSPGRPAEYEVGFGFQIP